MTKENESQTYSKMQKQLEKIVDEINVSDVDLDQLIKRVETGYELINQMRNRLDQSKKKIEELHDKNADVEGEELQ